MSTYKIVRRFFNGESKVIKTGLTLEEAQEHCEDPETSSDTCSDEVLDRVGRGPWFDSYSEE